jgi:predicted GNAT superfamily acetyltransferase
MIVIRSCAGFEEFEACVRLQVETWGYDDSDVIPRKAFLVGQKIGGQVIGAFDTGLEDAQPEGGPESLIGFALSLPGVKAGDRPQPYLHSHMLAVREAYRNRGLGAQLKLKQRLEALTRNLHLMEWTFDPLEIKNAHLNIHKLGAIVRGYHVNFYGVSSSRLQGGLPTDRLIAEWHLNSARVRAILAGSPRANFAVAERIRVPASIYRWKASDSEVDRERAVALQLENRHRFQHAFGQGLAVLGFVRDEEGNGVFELGSPTQAEMD